MGKHLDKKFNKKSKAKKNDSNTDYLKVAADSLGIKKIAKTRRGKKVMENRSPKLIENPKTAIFIKGNKSSNTTN